MSERIELRSESETEQFGRDYDEVNGLLATAYIEE